MTLMLPSPPGRSRTFKPAAYKTDALTIALPEENIQGAFSYNDYKFKCFLIAVRTFIFNYTLIISYVAYNVNKIFYKHEVNGQLPIV